MSLAALLCHYSFFSCKDNTLNVRINNNNNNYLFNYVLHCNLLKIILNICDCRGRGTANGLGWAG